MTMTETPKEFVVLNQRNSLHISPFGIERKLLNQGTLWHKIIIHNVANLDTENVLKTLLNSVHPLDLIPVNYKIDGENVYFIARNCGPAIEKLSRENLVIQNPGGQPLILTIILGFSNTAETQLNVQNNILEAIRKRYDPKCGLIDLESFHKDPALNELIFCVLSQPKILHFVLQLCKPFQPKFLKLGNNEIRSISSLEVLWSCKSLINLDLRQNLIENMVSLSPLKSMPIKELWLDGNPVCQNYDETGYMQAVREICPTIVKLDGVLLGSDGFLAYRRNYAINLNSESFVDQFLDHFFKLYDSNDRKHLIGLYHQNAFFSVSSSYIPHQSTSASTRLEPYKKLSRNLLKISDFSKTNEQLEVGPDNITNKFCLLPTTEHDPYTFTVDVLEFTDNKVTLSVTGAFREPGSTLNDIECLYCFCRTFVLISIPHGEYKIINELLHVSNASTNLANRSFKYVKIAQPKSTCSLRNARNDHEKDEFVNGLSQITALNKEWSKRCLEEAKWDLKQALEIFVDFYKLDKIPHNAFLRLTN